MIKSFISLGLIFLFTGSVRKNYSWLETYNAANTIEKRINVPEGFKRIETAGGTFAHWLRNLPLKPAGTPVKLWNGTMKYSQELHAGVVDLDFIGGNLQQCIDAVIRLRAEYLLSSGKENEIAFSYSCCEEKIKWEKWKQGWRTKIAGNKFQWVKTHKPDSSLKNFRSYLYSIMNYAGTLSLSRDMKKIDAAKVQIGDAYIHGAAPGSGHGVIILDMAVSSSGKRIMLLGQSYNPAENFNVIKSTGKYSPWFEVDFGEQLILPEWVFNASHARRFE